MNKGTKLLSLVCASLTLQALAVTVLAPLAPFRGRIGEYFTSNFMIVEIIGDTALTIVPAFAAASIARGGISVWLRWTGRRPYAFSPTLAALMIGILSTPFSIRPVSPISVIAIFCFDSLTIGS